MKPYRPLLLLLLLPLVVLAQGDQLMNGIDSSDTVRRILVDSSGRLVTSTTVGASGAHGACTNTTMNVGTTGTACPPTPRSDRATLLVQLVQTGETLTVTSDGATVATATDGVQVSSGGALEDDLLGTVSTSCRCTAATCSVRIIECP